MIDGRKKVCIVGYGNIGPAHAWSLRNVKNAVFYAVCDIDEKKVRLCQETYDVTAYEDYDKMLEDDRIDSVHICTPHYLHFEMIQKALKAGKDVFDVKNTMYTLFAMYESARSCGKGIWVN